MQLNIIEEMNYWKFETEHYSDICEAVTIEYNEPQEDRPYTGFLV